MKAPSGDLLFYRVGLLGCAIYLAFQVPTTAAEFQVPMIALAVCLAVEGVLLLVRFRWSPELFAAMALCCVAWSIMRVMTQGFAGDRIGMLAGAVVSLFGYPVLRGEIRKTGLPNSTSESATDDGE